MANPILGLDIGGANLKAAHTNGAARSVPFALWKNPGGLTAELRRLMDTMPAHERIAVTMTGELCDCYETRHGGVLAILQSALAAAGATPVRVWSTSGCFIDPQQLQLEPLRVAACNWLAQAHFVAQRFPDRCALLIDTGSTTTDIVYLNRGHAEPNCLVDADRLASGELVYTGIRRTPISAVLGLQGQVAAEFFATMLDAYVFAGLLPEDADDRDTADGRPLTRAFAHARLARMRCADAETFSEAQARMLAEQAVAVQTTAVVEACQRVLTAKPPAECAIASGSGAMLGRRVAGRLRLPVTSLDELLGPQLSEAACAYAVACLAQQESAHA
ncbi:MAG TPA: hydantoinase/oxoprolinase family protein [Gemmataceae bacterium]|nr:hydantoinase/oxoprolinase family protein [Gemmataceae bacterium]